MSGSTAAGEPLTHHAVNFAPRRFASTVCLLDDANACAPFSTSIVNVFYGGAIAHGVFVPTGHAYDCELLDTAQVEQTLDGMFYAVNRTTVGKLTFGVYLAKPAMEQGYTHFTRSILALGAPLCEVRDSDGGCQEAYASESDKFTDQRDVYVDEYFAPLEEKMWEYFGVEANPMNSPYRLEWTDGDLKVEMFNRGFSTLEWGRLTSTDGIWVLFSFVFVYIWAQVHTGHWFLAANCMAQIIMSVPVTALLYRNVIDGGIDFFQFIHMCTFFIVLGIGADDNFVLIDAWKQSFEEVPRRADNADWVQRRLIFAYTRAIESIFNTSFTTAASFLCFVANRIMPVQTFGIFAATAVIINYLMVCTFVPAALLVYDEYMANRCQGRVCCFCCCPTLSSRESPVTARPVEQEDGANPSEQGKTAALSESKEADALERFFAQRFVPFLLSKGPGVNVKLRALVPMLILGIWAVVCGVAMFQMTPPAEEEKWFPDDHMFTGILPHMTGDFYTSTGSGYVKVDYSFGISGIDTKDFDPYEPDVNRGVAKFDHSFDLYKQATRDGILSFCADGIPTVPCDEEGCDLGLLHLPGSRVCFLEEFLVWHALYYGSVDDASEAEFYERLASFRMITFPGAVYGAEFEGKTWERYIGFIDGVLEFVIVEVQLTLKRAQMVPIKMPIIARVNKFVDAQETATGLKIFHSAGASWAWYATMLELINGLFFGFKILFPLDFVVLIFATGNVILALYSIVSIMFVVACVMGTSSLVLGWELGVTETLAGVMVLGFSVDYIIHIGHMYKAAAHEGLEDRESRLAFALRMMGGTVIGGAVTTGGAGLFMFFCQLTFFKKIGYLIFMTIFYSIVFALLFLSAAFALIGPERKQGELAVLAKSVFANHGPKQVTPE